MTTLLGVSATTAFQVWNPEFAHGSNFQIITLVGKMSHVTLRVQLWFHPEV